VTGSDEEQSTNILLASSALAPEEIPGPCAIVIADEKIRSVSRQVDVAALRDRLPSGASTEVVDLRPWRIAPGYVDLHTHGFQGHDLTTGSQADVAAMALALPATGVTSFYATIASTGPAETPRQIENIRAAMGIPDRAAAEILGIRLEGPFINRAKKGAQYEDAIRPPDRVEIAALARHGPIRMVDFAPELDSGFDFLATLLHLGILPSIGHTGADYDIALAALDAGARHCTHLFNAMPPLEQRAPGAAGALLTDHRATVEVIADGIHLHPATLKLVVAARGPHAVALVTDAVVAAGMPAGQYTFVGRDVSVDHGAVRLADGTLAGSILTLDRAVRNMVTLAGVSWPDAVRMATQTPATIAGVAGRKGALVPGADADLVVLDDGGAVQQTWRAGRLVAEPKHSSS
jgi:N-acetylglucosamine-6-phosphate deacetylase